MNVLLQRLGVRARRGSKPRCHWITHGEPVQVAARLTKLAAPWATVSATDRWMPQGFDVLEEAQLHQAPRLIGRDIGQQLAQWWLPADRLDARTPNFDIASTCLIGGAPGLLLIEAKAHDEELHKENVGRSLGEKASEDREASHRTIRKAISDAQKGLGEATGLSWRISRDTHYQMSNRFAWAWKVTELLCPVVLVYLGFLNANEMADRGEPLVDHSAWEALVKSHSHPLFPAKVWGQEWNVHGRAFIPLIRSVEIVFDEPVKDFDVA